MNEVVELLGSWALTTALTFAVVIAHERLMSEERRERAWPPASRDAAIVAFGPLALPFHFARTLGRFFTFRALEHVKWWLGFAMGLAIAVVISLLASLPFG